MSGGGDTGVVERSGLAGRGVDHKTWCVGAVIQVLLRGLAWLGGEWTTRLSEWGR